MNGVALHDYAGSAAANQLTFVRGSRLVVSSEHGQGWSHGALLDEEGKVAKTGYFPSAYFQSDNAACYAQHDFSGKSDEHQLTFQAGSKIEILAQSSREWWYGRLIDGSAAEGYFPASFVKVLESASDAQPGIDEQPTNGARPEPSVANDENVDEETSAGLTPRELHFQSMLSSCALSSGKCRRSGCSRMLVGNRKGGRYCVEHSLDYYTANNN